MSTLLKECLHPDASDALRAAGIEVWQVGQVIGNAPASAGTHAADGTINGHAYCAAVDIRVRDKDGNYISADAVKAILSKLADHGLCGFYRNPGHDHWPATEKAHIHAVFASCPMKQMLRHQVHDWLAQPMLNGLASHVAYAFWQPSQGQKNIARTLFLAHNPMND